MCATLKGIFSFKKNNPGKRNTPDYQITDKIILNALMDNVTDNLYFKDANSRFLRVNKAMSDYFNLKKQDDIIGKTDFDFFTEEHARKAFEDEQRIIQSGESIKREEKETWENQHDTWVSTLKMPLYNTKGKIIGTFGISRDITDFMTAKLKLNQQNKEIERQNEAYVRLNKELRDLNEHLSIAKEKAEESDKLKSTFLHTLSHEVRTPLNAIMGFSNLMPKYFEDKIKLEEYNEVIKQRSSDLLNIINGILDIAKIETGQYPVYPEVFNLNELFNELTTFYTLHKKRMGKENIRINFVCPNPEEYLITDKTKLKQILINLLDNAFKFTETGSIELQYQRTNDKKIEFIVMDSGIGIPKVKHNYIFERFAQVEEGNNRKYGGTGLGLAIVKGLTELLGGDVRLESEHGKGSTFYIKIPFLELK